MIIAVTLSLVLNLHHVLLGASFAAALMSSLTFTAANRFLVMPLFKKILLSEGVPVGGNRTEQYATTPSGFALYVDVFEPPTPARRPRTTTRRRAPLAVSPRTPACRSGSR